MVASCSAHVDFCSLPLVRLQVKPAVAMRPPCGPQRLASDWLAGSQSDSMLAGRPFARLDPPRSAHIRDPRSESKQPPLEFMAGWRLLRAALLCGITSRPARLARLALLGSPAMAPIHCLHCTLPHSRTEPKFGEIWPASAHCANSAALVPQPIALCKRSAPSYFARLAAPTGRLPSEPGKGAATRRSAVRPPPPQLSEPRRDLHTAQRDPRFLEQSV